MSTEEFTTFLEQLAIVIEFTRLKPDRYGACLIEMQESKLNLLFEYDHQLVPNTILVSTLIGSFSIDHRQMIYEEILKGNADIVETLSVKPDEDLVFLHQRIHPEIQSTDLGQLLKNFEKRALEWQTKISDLNKQQPRKPNEPPTFKTYPFKA